VFTMMRQLRICINTKLSKKQAAIYQKQGLAAHQRRRMEFRIIYGPSKFGMQLLIHDKGKQLCTYTNVTHKSTTKQNHPTGHTDCGCTDCKLTGVATSGTISQWNEEVCHETT